MSETPTPGRRLRRSVEEERPLQVVGTINAYHAIMAQRVGFRALYLSGGGKYLTGHNHHLRRLRDIVPAGNGGRPLHARWHRRPCVCRDLGRA